MECVEITKTDHSADSISNDDRITIALKDMRQPRPRGEEEPPIFLYNRERVGGNDEDEDENFGIYLFDLLKCIKNTILPDANRLFCAGMLKMGICGCTTILDLTTKGFDACKPWKHPLFVQHCEDLSFLEDFVEQQKHVELQKKKENQSNNYTAHMQQPVWLLELHGDFTKLNSKGIQTLR